MEPTVPSNSTTLIRHNRANQNKELLEARIEMAQSELSRLTSQLRHHPNFEPARSDKHEISDQAVIEAAESLNKAYIKQVSAYNEIRDIGMQLTRLIAEKEGKTLKAMLKEKGMDGQE